jgi:pseudouridine-5'-phosphate glycosidase
MPETLPPFFSVSAEVQRARQLGAPIVALESTVITHGLPRPQNLEVAEAMEAAVRSEGAVPATVAVIDGKILLGITSFQLEQLATEIDPVKVSQRDFADALRRKVTGGTTVAGTMYAAHKAGIGVFATGGIGGVHRLGNRGEGRYDVSTDLQALSTTPMFVVCAGAKSILDLPATLEYLETMSVPVIGWRTEKFPAFFSASSGLPVTTRIGALEDLLKLARIHWGLGFESAVLVCQALSAADEVPRDAIEPAEVQAEREAWEQGIHGQALSPFLLKRVKELTHGRSLTANETLLVNNARLAAQIAKALAQGVGRIVA